MAAIDLFHEDELGFAPVAGGYTIGEIAVHIAHEEEIEIHYGLARLIADVPEPYPAARFPSKRSIVDQLAGVHARSIEVLHGLSPTTAGGGGRARLGGAAAPDRRHSARDRTRNTPPRRAVPRARPPGSARIRRLAAEPSEQRSPDGTRDSCLACLYGCRRAGSGRARQIRPRRRVKETQRTRRRRPASAGRRPGVRVL